MIMSKPSSSTTKLTKHERESSATFKLLSSQIGILKRSLKKTQDKLEEYRGKFHEADKNHAIEVNKNKTLVLHEIAKFVVSAAGAGIGVNLITDGKIRDGFVWLICGIVVYSVIVYLD